MSKQVAKAKPAAPRFGPMSAQAREAVETGEKVNIGMPDALESAQAEALAWKAGSHKLALSVDALRTALETIVVAEMDYSTKPPRTVSVDDLKKLAVEGLDAYSALTGQNWRLNKNKIRGSYAGDRSLNFSEEDSGDE